MAPNPQSAVDAHESVRGEIADPRFWLGCLGMVLAVVLIGVALVVGELVLFHAFADWAQSTQ